MTELAWPIQEVERVEGLSPERFHHDYVARRRPVLLAGLARAWPAVARWTPAYFQRAFPGLRISVEVWGQDDGRNDPLHFMQHLSYAQMTLGRYIQRLLATERPTREYYLAQFHMLRALPQLHDDIGSLEPYMVPSPLLPEPVRRRLRLPAAFWLGPAGSVATLHFDPVDNLFVQAHGKKRVLLVSPAQSRNVYYPHDRFKSLNFSPLDVERPDFDRFPAARALAPLSCEVTPGDVLYIPMGWWHYLRATEMSISLNFWWVYWRHIPPVLAYFGRRRLRDLRERLGLLETITIPRNRAAPIGPDED
jgi:[protein]-arginine 3-hydroxylase / protease